MTKSEYRGYIQSEYWQSRRREFLQEIFGCEECGIPRWAATLIYDQDLNVDHKNYQNLGCELDDDLQALCRRCHEIKHFGVSDLKAVRVPECPACGQEIWGNVCIGCEYEIGRITEYRSWRAAMKELHTYD